MIDILTNFCEIAHKTSLRIGLKDWCRQCAAGYTPQGHRKRFIFSNAIRTPKIIVRWLPKNSIDDESTLVLVMAWCRQATSHYLSQCWLRSMSPYGIIRPQWIKKKCLYSLPSSRCSGSQPAVPGSRLEGGGTDLEDYGQWNTHRSRDKMAAISQKIFSNAFSWMKTYEFRLSFHWSLFLRFELTIFQH